MRNTEETIRAKWARKIEEMKSKAEFKYSVILSNKKAKIEKEWDYQYEKVDKKKRIYIRKKEEQYLRKMRNEIRKLEWKPQREYKTPWPKIDLEFAMQIAQENARLKDTDANGNGHCISCGKYCEWGELAWGHRYSRRFKTLCLEEHNIHAQCHTCNWTTWPKGNTREKYLTNERYDKELDRRYGEWTAQHLKDLVVKDVRCKWKKYNVLRLVPQLINRNEKLRKEKNFYSPKRKWREIWNEYKKRHPKTTSNIEETQS